MSFNIDNQNNKLHYLESTINLLETISEIISGNYRA
jgi:hypothetical protein